MTTGQQLVNLAITQFGDRYVFGAETRPADPNPRYWDCSEYTEWVCARNGVYLPDGAFNQWRHCRAITVSQAAGITGSLLFFGDGTGTGRSAITHVVFSRGNGTTAEARSTKYGVGSWAIAGRPFRYAGLIPGVDYSSHTPVTRPPLPPLGSVDLKAIAGAITMCKQGSILKLGDHNDCVKWLQAGINNISGRGLTVDGVFGLSTLAAVQDLQRWFHIGVDGIVGPKTWGLIYP